MSLRAYVKSIHFSFLHKKLHTLIKYTHTHIIWKLGEREFNCEMISLKVSRGVNWVLRFLTHVTKLMRRYFMWPLS